MTTPARPTVRCLKEDLDSDWTSVDDKRSVAQLDQCTVALYSLAHRIIRKAAEDFPAGGAADVFRESISGLSNPVWWKVKIGSRWRGAVTVDDSGQAWLCAAGYRREGEGSDFYRRFMAGVGSSGPDYYLPTEADRDLLRRELDERRFVDWEGALQAQVLD